MYKIKQKPEDFIVKEILSLRPGQEGKYAAYLMEKVNYTTTDAIALLSKRLKIDLKYFNYCGLKDRQAWTFQYVSISQGPQKDADFGNVKLKYLGQLKERLRLGQLEKNEFKIVVRNLGPAFNERMVNENPYVVNYFDEQRFSKNNLDVGIDILKGRFREALTKILEEHSALRSESDELLKKNDYIGVFRKLPKRIQSVYLHAVQSYFFNEAVKEMIERVSDENKAVEYSLGTFLFPKTEASVAGLLNKKISLISFDYAAKDLTVEKSYQKLLERYGIDKRDFIIRKVPDLTPHTAERDVLIKIENLHISRAEEDELYPGKRKMAFSFYLPKGSYATLAMKHLL